MGVSWKLSYKITIRRDKWLLIVIIYGHQVKRTAIDKEVHPYPTTLFRQCDSVNYYRGFVLLLSGDSDDTFENTKTNNINLRSRYKLI